MRKIREIIWQNIIGDKVREIYGSQEIADEALRGVELELTRNPRIEDVAYCVYKSATGECLWAYKTRTDCFATIVVYFTLDDNTVTVHDIIEALP